jgi:xanthine dehydrogenase YagS FAD-binding subunit
VPLEDLHRLPGDAPHLEHALGPSELVVAIRLPADAADYAGNARYLKVRDRTSFAFALVSAAAALRIEGGVIAAARLALGGVAARPWRCYSAEASLAGKAPEPRHFIDAAELALAGARPSGDNAYKIELSKRVIVSTLGRAALGTPERLPALPGSAFGDAAHDVAFEDA